MLLVLSGVIAEESLCLRLQKCCHPCDLVIDMYFVSIYRNMFVAFSPIVDGGEGGICPPPLAVFLNIAQKQLGLGS